MVEVAADVGEVLLPLILGPLEELVQLSLLGFVFSQQVHGLGQLEVQFAPAAAPTQLGDLRVQGQDGIGRRVQRLHA